MKLCPRGHRNPRNAEACSLCGSRDFSTPQPRTPFWVPMVEPLVKLVPGAFLAVATVVILIVAIQGLLERPQLILSFFFLFVALGILWGIWSQLPAWFRSSIYRLLKRRREGHDRKGGH